MRGEEREAIPPCKYPRRAPSMMRGEEVHFRGYPRQLLIPCEGEDSIKWSFINSLKEADYIINGNTKNVMSMSEPDLLELWRSVSNGMLASAMMMT
uniref:Autophagy protein ATG5 alpha-helical bundle region domain-containing protein n=1 Tax=Cucumis sativus TaxID=3659 RepID=A0A0A0L6X2_CUCSA